MCNGKHDGRMVGRVDEAFTKTRMSIVFSTARGYAD
jgi:hypothetical protein